MRRLLAAALALTLALVGCAPGPDEPDPAPSGPVTERPDLPRADAAVEALIAALNGMDVSALPMVQVADEAQEELETIFAGMDEIHPVVGRESVAYELNDDVAIATLTMDYPLGEQGWSFTTEARFNYAGEQWRVDWTPTIIHPALTEQTRMRHSRQEARRAPINDRDGIAIVEEGSMYEVGLDKGGVVEAEWETAARDLAKILEIDADDYVDKVIAYGPRAYVVGATMVQAEIPATITDVPGVLVREISAIIGPGESFAAPLLGTVGTPTAEMIEESGGELTELDRVGLSGLQERYDEELRGVPGIRVDAVARNDVEVGPSESPIPEVTLFQQDPSVGSGITLSLDRDLQTRAEEVLSEQEGMAALVVVDLTDGGILAAAQSPAGGSYPYATFGRYAPGSTFKTVTSLAMLRTGMRPTSTVNCSSSLQVSSYTFGNYSGYPSSALGRIPLTTAFAQSCNTAFASQYEDVTGGELNAAAGSLGVGTDYDVGFPANFGTVDPVNAIDRAASMIGQGQVTMSPMGMAAVAASIGAGKTTLPWLVDGYQASPTTDPLGSGEANNLQTLMKATVSSGTAKSMQGLMTGAKTGTAQWGETGNLKTSAWMIAYNSDVAVASFVEEGDSGGSTAGPLITALFN